MSDDEFFHLVKDNRQVTDVLAKHGFLEPIVYRRGDGGVHNDGVIFRKRAWYLPAKGERVERVNVHFECTRPGHLARHVEIDPYEKAKSIKANDVRLTTLADELKRKADLLGTVRHRVMSDDLVEHRFGATTSQLEPVDHPNANSAVKFSGPDAHCSPEEFAVFVAEVIDALAPTIDELVAAHRAKYHQKACQ